jgi:tetratricopeptide (TPR) repeat protein
MRITRAGLAFLLFVLSRSIDLDAQSISEKDASAIVDHAKKLVNEYAVLLNTIVTGTDMETADMDLLIQNSFSQAYKSRCFFDSTATLDDDIKPKSRTAKHIIQPVVRDYLEDIHNFYVKSDTNAVFIKNVSTSRVKRASYLYIKVYFDYLIKSKSIIPDAPPYEMTQKVAEMRAERVENKWHTWIVNVHFITQTDRTDISKNDVEIITDSVISSIKSIVENEGNDSSNELTNRSKAIVSEEDKKRIQRTNDSLALVYAYNSLITDADKARKENDTSFALQRYHEAYLLKPEDPYAKNQMTLIGHQINRVELTPQQQYDLKLQKARVAETERKYDSALNIYREAQKIKPDDPQISIKEKIQQLSLKISNINRIEFKYKSNQFKEAIEDCRTLIKKDALCTDYYFLMGKCYDKLNDFKKAKEAYLKAISLDATNLDAFKMCGALFERFNDRPNAIANYSNASNLDKNDVGIFVKLADLKWAGGQSEDGIHDIDKGIEANPKSAVLFEKKGTLLFGLRKYSQARENFNFAIENNPGVSSSFYYRGLSEIELREIPAAGEDFSKARSIGLDSTALKNIFSIANNFYITAQNFAGRQRYDSAIAYFDFAVMIDPARSEYRFSRGESYLNLNDYENAALNYTDAIERKNNFFEAYRQRGRARMSEKKYKEAAADFEDAVQLARNIPELLKLRGDAYFMLLKNVEAINSYNSGLNADKDSKIKLSENILAELYDHLGESYFRQGNFAEALANFKNANRHNKTSAEILFNLGKTFLQINEIKDAEINLISALQYNPHVPAWNLTLGILYQRKGEYKEAVARYSLALSLDTGEALGLDPVYYRGVCLDHENKYDEALKDYQFIESKKEESKYPGFSNELGNILLEKRLAQDAEKCFRRSLLSDSSDAMAQYGIAICFIQQKQNDEAMIWFEKSFSSGKLKKKRVASDPLLADIKEDKQFKKLIKKYL